jgi:SAM-dependent methyltransferase
VADQWNHNVEYRHGDFFDLPLRHGSFDLVTAVASLHHMGTEAGLSRMAELLRPGGVLAVIGLARCGWSLPDLALELPAAIGNRIELLRHRPVRRKAGYQPPVVWPPAETYRQIRGLAARLLPGMRYRRHLLWRYSICWQKPR